MTPAAEVMRCEGITKYFGAVRALSNASLSLNAGEIIALVGDNGAGKSTLVRIISGVERSDQGRIFFENKELRGLTPWTARELGIETVHQHLALCDNLSGAGNVMLGREPVRFSLGPIKVFNRRAAVDQSEALLAEVGAEVPDLRNPVRRLSGGQRQALAIARAMAGSGKLIMFDEPTAALGIKQTRATLRLIRQIAAKGVSVLIISHSIPDVLQLADRVVAMRHGSIVFDAPISEVDEDRIIEGIAGMSMTGKQTVD